MTTPIELQVLPSYETISRTDISAAFVARVDPPAMPEERGPVTVILAIDISGSMRGEKLTSAKRSASALIRALGPLDTFGCVVFNHLCCVVVPPTLMTAAGKNNALAHVAEVDGFGNTDIAQALLKSLDLVNDLSGGHVLLLTDGQPTSGVTRTERITTLTGEAMNTSTLSTLGYGDDVDPHLLQALADAGRGTFTFIDGPEAPLAAIGGELGGLMRTVMTAGTLRIQPGAGVTLRHVYRTSGLRFDRETGAAVLDLPPLVAGEPVRVAFELAWKDRVPASLGTVSFRGRCIETGVLGAVEREVRPVVAEVRGAPVPEAVKHLVLAKAAAVVDAASKATSQHPREVARGLAHNGELLAREAKAAKVYLDEQVLDALAMITRARRALESANPLVVKAAWHGMVAASGALRALKGTMVVSEPGKQVRVSRFTTMSQHYGMDLLRKTEEEAKPKAGIIQDANGEKEPSGTLH